jgi:hypothetical protein
MAAINYYMPAIAFGKMPGMAAWFFAFFALEAVLSKEVSTRFNEYVVSLGWC